MTATVIDGKQIAEQTRAEAAAGALALKTRTGVIPHLAAVLVGEDPASAVYVRNKRIACDKAGFKSTLHRLPANTGQAELLALVQALNADSDVHGILVQLPLPKGIDTAQILDAILPAKDVDGFHPENVGLMQQGRPRFLPCTPAGVMRMLQGLQHRDRRHARRGDRSQRHRRQAHGGVAGTEGRRCDGDALPQSHRRHPVLLPRSRHPRRRTRHPAVRARATGSSRAPWSSTSASTASATSWWVTSITCRPRQVASAITPVPGGVGPMTIAMLLANTLQAATKLAESHGR